MGMERWRCWQNMSWNPEDLQSQNLHRKARCTHLITALVGVVLEVAEIGRSLGLAGHPASLAYSVGSKSIRDHFPKWKSEERRGRRCEEGRDGGREERIVPNSVCTYMKFPKNTQGGEGNESGGEMRRRKVCMWIVSEELPTRMDLLLPHVHTCMHIYTHMNQPHANTSTYTYTCIFMNVHEHTHIQKARFLWRRTLLIIDQRLHRWRKAGESRIHVMEIGDTTSPMSAVLWRTEAGLSVWKGQLPAAVTVCRHQTW